MKMSFLKTYSHKRKNIKTFCSKKQKYLKRARRFKYEDKTESLQNISYFHI